MEDQSGVEGESHILLKTGNDVCPAVQGLEGEMAGSQSGLASSHEHLVNADCADLHTIFFVYG